MISVLGRPSPVFNSARRSTQREILDQGIDIDELANVLRDLARFNGAMMGHWSVLRWLFAAARNYPPEHPLTILDVGCGYGDLLRVIRRWGRRRGYVLNLIGIDLDPQVIAVAREATTAEEKIDYRAADVFGFDPGVPLDFIVSSLLTHHFSDAMIVRFLRWMDSTVRRGWFIYDLQRSRIPFHFIALAGVLMRLHPIVSYDGQISVARALTRKEWQQRISDASISAESVQLRWFMFRHVIGRII